jgi:hypothetical protein
MEIFVKDDKAALAVVKALAGAVRVESGWEADKQIFFPSGYGNLEVSLRLIEGKQLRPCKPGCEVEKAKVVKLITGRDRPKRINGRQQLLLTDGREQ